MATLATSVSPSVLRAISDANKRWPERLRKLADGKRPGIASDGTLPSEAHLKQSPKSRHNDGSAFDLTHDPESGCEGDVIAMLALKDPRTEEIIWNKRIWTRPREAEGWRPYSGKNPHTSHIHITTFLASKADVSPWPWSPEYVDKDAEGEATSIRKDAATVGKVMLAGGLLYGFLRWVFTIMALLCAVLYLCACEHLEAMSAAATEYPQAVIEAEDANLIAFDAHLTACKLHQNPQACREVADAVWKAVADSYQRLRCIGVKIVTGKGECR